MLVKPQSNPVARIKVVGVGGGGGNVVNTMVADKGILDVEFIAINTDSQALANSLADTKIKIGEQITRGLGSGGNPVIGRKAAEESVDEIHEHLAGADMIFITAGMGGGTGTGASPIVGEISKNLGALTIAVVMKPFEFEGKRRMESALKGIEDLREKVDTMIVIPNQRLLEIMEPNASFLDAMRKSDEVLLQAVKSIANLSSQTGLINVDFADVRSVMDDAGTALMGVGEASGEDRAMRAAQMAIESPLLEVRVDGATGVLFNVVGGRDLGIQEIDQAAQMIKERIADDANFIFGAMIDPTMDEDSMRVTVIATGFSDADTNLIISNTAGRNRALPSATRKPSVLDEDEPPIQQAPQPRGNIFSTPDTGNDDLDEMPSYLRRRSA
ncbi:MAG: cell division protein FtsZ [Candidatus Doudnabacteria bacterium]|nr:cell division protein FtsZ [Candidatus Doudnabacteria bacterium]